MTGRVAKRQKIRVRRKKVDPPCSNQSRFPMGVVSVGWGVTQNPHISEPYIVVLSGKWQIIWLSVSTSETSGVFFFIYTLRKTIL